MTKTTMINTVADRFDIFDPYKMEHVTRRYTAIRTAYAVPNGYMDVYAQGYWLNSMGIPFLVADPRDATAESARIIDMRPGTESVTILVGDLEMVIEPIGHDNDFYGMVTSIVSIRIRDSWHPESQRATKITLGMDF